MRVTRASLPARSFHGVWGPTPPARPLLLPFAAIYRRLIARRNRHYDKPENIQRAPVPIISIGNITTGGTGKTPLVIEIVRRLLALGKRPAILTRGYGATKNEVADEVLEFNDALPQTPVVVDKNRVRGAATAVREHHADCCVLDDGLQHRRLHRDLDIVLIDALDPFGGGQLLPAGRLREPLESLRRADLLIITRANQVLPQGLAFTRAELERIAPGKPILTAAVKVTGLNALDAGAPLERTAPPNTSAVRAGVGTPSPAFAGDSRALATRPPDVSALHCSLPLTSLANQRVIPVCGLGNPKTFRGLIANAAKESLGQFTFADHHRYRAEDVQKIARYATEHLADSIVTTRKDWVKLAPLWRTAKPACPLLRLEIELRVDDPNGELDALLRAAIATSATRGQG